MNEIYDDYWNPLHNVSQEQKYLIRNKQQELNPFELAKGLEQKLETFFREYRQSIIQKETEAA